VVVILEVDAAAENMKNHNKLLYDLKTENVHTTL
jgi:hypothetical protein